MRQASQQGGFAAQNNGTIIDCYSLTEVRGGKGLAGGFAATNSGALRRCFSASRLKGLTGGFTGQRGGKIEDCYFFHGKNSGASLKRLHDVALSQPIEDVRDVEDAAQLGFDVDGVWEYGGKKALLMFDAASWLYDVRGSKLYADKEGRRSFIIQTADDLRAFAQRVNAGDAAVRNAYVRLEQDINLGGKPWTPIGAERTCAFCGLFDGGGHTVKNFTLSDKQGDQLGFFGVLRGEVYNLSLDCRVKGGGCVGAFAAQCEGGIIGCCSAVADISGKSGLLGGFVGMNTGTIFRCYSAGRVHTGVLLLPLLLANAALLLAILLLLWLPKARSASLPTYAQVPYDEDAVPIEEDLLTPNTDGNFVSFQFEQEIDVNRSSGLCKFGFKNPGNSNHNIVVQLQFTDAQALRVMGSTGRSAEEQALLDNDPDYDPESNRVVLAESGAIPPGYELNDLRLVRQANGARVPTGSFNAMVYLVFYDINTNARAMLESQLPVVITVHD